MHELLQDELFDSVSEIFLQFSSHIKNCKEKIFLFSSPTLEGALALAPLEAALLDEKIPYRRRFSEVDINHSPSINILKENIFSGSELENDRFCLTISGEIVEGLRGINGDRKQGPLSTISQAHALAQAISPSSSRLKYLRPWALAGNWLETSLDNTYDPVFSKLKQLLENEGTIKIVPITEVKEPFMESYNWLNKKDLNSLSLSWDELDFESKSVSISNLIKPILSTSLPSTARVEELTWNCIVGNGWQTDLAGQLFSLKKNWKTKENHIQASNLIEKLLKKGHI